jgi:Furin-like repeat, cysteine-rich/LNR domain
LQTNGGDLEVSVKYPGSLKTPLLSNEISKVNTKTVYTFSFVASNPVPSNSYIIILFPSSIQFQVSAINPIFGFDYQTLSYSYSASQITISTVAQTYKDSGNNFLFSVSYCINPMSTQIAYISVVIGYGQYTSDTWSSFGIQATPGDITLAPISGLLVNTSPPYINTNSTYAINYTLSDPIPQQGVIQIQLSYLNSSAGCYLNQQLINCTYSSNLTLYSSFNTTGIITLYNVFNPLVATNYTFVISSGTKDGYIIDQYSTYVTITCKSPCSTCLDFADNCQSCLTSSSEPYYWGNKCNSVCDRGYVDTGSKTCMKCSSPCSACLVTTSSCTSCTTGYLYINTCLPQCPESTYANSTSCLNCPSPCKTCSSDSTCSSCAAPYNLYMSACVLSCPENTTVAINGSCEACIGCLTCKNSVTVCTSCASSEYIYNNTCYAQCPESTLVVSNICAPCSSNCKSCELRSDFCVSCYDGEYLIRNTCAPVCPSGYYYYDSACKPCSYPCDSCSLNMCLTCLSGLYLYNRTCVSVCPYGYYSLNGVCSSCSSNCYDCVDAGTCRACSSGYYLYQLQCLDQCPAGTFNNNYVCVSCGTCAVCDASRGCLDCPQGFFFNGSCVNSCPTGYFGAKHLCGQCQGCHECAGQATVCTSCIEGMVLLNTSCLNSCPEGYTQQNSTCTYQNRSLCAPECPDYLLQNGICDTGCNTTACDYDNNECLPAPSMNKIPASSLDVKENPLIITSLSVAGLVLSAVVSSTTNAIFLNLLTPVISSFKSVSWLCMLASLNKANTFNGRTLTDVNSQLSVILSIMLVVGIIHVLVNCAFTILYLKKISQSDGQHKQWVLNHKSGLFFIILGMLIFSFKIIVIILSKIPCIQVFNTKFDKANTLLRPLILTDIFNLILTVIPIIGLEVYILYRFSTGSFVFIMAFDSLIVTALSAFLSVYFIVKFFCEQEKRIKTYRKGNEDCNATVEITEGVSRDKHPKLNIQEDKFSNPSKEGFIPQPEVYSITETHDNIITKKNHSSSLQSSTKEHMKKNFNNLKGQALNKKAEHNKTKHLFKQFIPPVTIDEDGETTEVSIDLSDYMLISIDDKNPKIGLFKHKTYNTIIKLLRHTYESSNSDSSSLTENQNLGSDEPEKTFRIVYSFDENSLNSEVFNLPQVNDSVLSIKSFDGIFEKANKIMLRSGSPPKLSCSKIISPNPGIRESSSDSP